MSLWDEISKLVSGTGQSIGQTFSQPGSIMEAIGVPLALLGSYEAARGKPIGTPLSLAGGGLTYFGDQRSQSAQAQESFKRALALLKQQMSPTNGYGSGNKAGPPSPMGPGLQETVDAIGNLGQADPQAGMTAIQNQLQHYWASQAKQPKPEPKMEYMTDASGHQVPGILSQDGWKPISLPPGFSKPTNEKPPFMLDAFTKANFGGKGFEQLNPEEKKSALAGFQQSQQDPKIAMFMKEQAARDAQWQRHFDETEARHEDRANATNAKQLAAVQRRTGASYNRMLDDLGRQGRTILTKAKDKTFPQMQLSALIDSYNDTAESVNQRIQDGINNGDVTPNFKYKKPQKLSIGAGSPLWIPYLKQPSHGLVTSGASEGDID